METTIKTSFNFAKEIQCNFITKNNPEHSYPGGLPEFITPYLQELQENTLIPDYTTLISITTIDNPDQDGIHILTFLKNDPEHFDDDDTASITFIEYYAWDEDEDGPIPGIKLFKDLNIYLEREYCEY